MRTKLVGKRSVSAWQAWAVVGLAWGLATAPSWAAEAVSAQQSRVFRAGACAGRHAHPVPGDRQRRLPVGDRRPGKRPAARALAGPGRRRNAGGPGGAGHVRHPPRVWRRRESPRPGRHRHSPGTHHALGHAHAQRPVADAGPGHGRRSGLSGVRFAADRGGPATRGGQPGSGPGRLGDGPGGGLHAHPRLDPPPGPAADGSFRRADRAGQHAPGLPEPGHDRARGTVRPRTDPPGRAVAAGPAAGGPGEFLHALLRLGGRVGRLLWRIRGETPAARRPGRRFARLRRHHVARHQWRPALDGLRPAAAEGQSG